MKLQWGVCAGAQESPRVPLSGTPCGSHSSATLDSSLGHLNKDAIRLSTHLLLNFLVFPCTTPNHDCWEHIYIKPVGVVLGREPNEPWQKGVLRREDYGSRRGPETSECGCLTSHNQSMSQIPWKTAFEWKPRRILPTSYLSFWWFSFLIALICTM